MRKLPAVLAAAMVTGVVAASPAQAAESPTVARSQLLTDAGTVGVLDAGDVIRIRFSRPVVVTDITSFGIEMVGANGEFDRLENEVSPYGMNYKLKGRTLTIFVNLVPDDYEPGIPPTLTYPVRLESGHPWEQVFFNIEGRNGAPIAVEGDLLID